MIFSPTNRPLRALVLAVMMLHLVTAARATSEAAAAAALPTEATIDATATVVYGGGKVTFEADDDRLPKQLGVARGGMPSSGSLVVMPTFADFQMSLLFLLAILLLRFVVPYYVLMPALQPRVRPVKEVQNACDHTMKFMFHLALFFWGVRVMWKEPWLKSWAHPTKDIWSDFPFSTVSSSLQCYYQAQFAFYCSGTIFHFLESRRKDFWVMIFHHLCAAGLIFFSYIFCYHRIGFLVLVTREFSDIFLHFTKVAVYLGKSNLGMAGFLTLMTSWVPLRLIIYPYCILFSTYVDTYGALGHETYRRWIYHYWGFNFALASLVPLDWYYFIVGLQIAYRRATTGSLKDSLEKQSPTTSPTKASKFQ